LFCVRSWNPKSLAEMFTVEAFGVDAASCSPALPGFTWVSILHISARIESALAKAPGLSLTVIATVPVRPSLVALMMIGMVLCIAVCGSSISIAPFSTSELNTSMLLPLAITFIWPIALLTVSSGTVTEAV